MRAIVLTFFFLSLLLSLSVCAGYKHPWATALSLHAGAGGKLPLPPDPAVFAELAEIVEGRLKESLNRYVNVFPSHSFVCISSWGLCEFVFIYLTIIPHVRLVLATYNNVGMPRAYCGGAGGFVIGLIGSAPPLASSFALGGPRWYRILALPGMWLGMTIFISAFYGVSPAPLLPSAPSHTLLPSLCDVRKRKLTLCFFFFLHG